MVFRYRGRQGRDIGAPDRQERVDRDRGLRSHWPTRKSNTSARLTTAATVKQYAQKFVSDPGKQNGLYWPVAEGQAASPLGELGDFAKAVASNTGDQPPLFNGYYYRILPPSDR